MKLHKLLAAAALGCTLLLSSSALAADAPLNLRTMGSMSFGGTVTQLPQGETFHGDHGYAQYFIPQKARRWPLVLWHGINQSGACWETTPDGREGFMQLLPRAGWATYIIDQPRRGRAGYTNAKNTQDISPTAMKESETVNAFRLGIWTPPEEPQYFERLAFPLEADALDHFFRKQTPDTGEQQRTAEHREFLADTVCDLFKQIGGGILVTHSRSGEYGWFAAMNSQGLIKGIVAYEPAAFPFPEGETPERIPSGHPLVEQFQQPIMVPAARFEELAKMPIMIVYGDNIAKEQTELFNPEVWRCAQLRAKHFVDGVNRHGGDAVLISLPERGIYGNTHAAFADLNNKQTAAMMTEFLENKSLGGYSNPHKGPAFLKD